MVMVRITYHLRSDTTYEPAIIATRIVCQVLDCCVKAHSNSKEKLLRLGQAGGLGLLSSHRKQVLDDGGRLRRTTHSTRGIPPNTYVCQPSDRSLIRVIRGRPWSSAVDHCGPQWSKPCVIPSDIKEGAYTTFLPQIYVRSDSNQT